MVKRQPDGPARAVTVLLLLVAAAACGEPALGPGTAPPAASTTVVPTTVPLTAATTPPSTTPTTATATTSTTDPAALLRADGTPVALPPIGTGAPPGLAPASEVPWSDVGPGWLLLVTGMWPDPSHLVLLGPGDDAYGIGGWGTSGQLLDWDGRRIVTLTGNRMAVLDLATGEETAGFVPAGAEDALWVTGTIAGDAGLVVVGAIGLEGEDRFTVSLRDRQGDAVATLLDREYVPEGAWASWARHPSGGTFALVDGSALTVFDDTGAVVSELGLPGEGCSIRRWWAGHEVLVSCVDAEYARSATAACWPGSGRRLWVVPTDGTRPVPLTPPVGPGGDDCDGYQPEYRDAIDLDGVLLVESGGCCECGGDLVAVLDDGTLLGPADDDTLRAIECGPRLAGARNGAAALVVGMDFDDGWDWVLVAVGPSLDHRRLLGDTSVRVALAYPGYASP